MPRRSRLTFASVVLAASTAAAGAPASAEEDWAHFRGPNGTGVTTGTLPDAFSDENLVWSVELPKGYSSPTVVGDCVFVTAAEGESLLTICLDRFDGEERWRRELPFSGKRTGASSPAASSPVSDGESIFCTFHDFGLVAYDLEGEELWARELGPFSIPHGFSTSPVLCDDALLLQMDQDSGSSLLAVDAVDGETRWQVERPGFTHSYSTPAIYEPEDGPAQVIVSGSFRIVAHSVEDGSEAWSVDGSCFMTKAIPLVVGDHCYLNAYAAGSTEAGLPRLTQSFDEALAEKDTDGDGKISQAEFDNQAMNSAWAVFDLNDDGAFDARDWEYLRASNSPTGALMAIRLGGSGNITDTHVTWKYDGRRGLPDVTSPIVVGDALLAIKTGGLLTSFATSDGSVVKQDRVGDPDRYFASPVSAGGRVLLASLSGQLTVVSAEQEWEVVSVSDLEEEIWSTPALCGEHVYVRTQSSLHCFGASVPR